MGKIGGKTGGRRRNSKKSFAGSQSQRASPIRSLPCHQVRPESETQLTLVKQVKSARVTIRRSQVKIQAAHITHVLYWQHVGVGHSFSHVY